MLERGLRAGDGDRRDGCGSSGATATPGAPVTDV